MPPRQGYCQPDDLLIGKIPLPRGTTAEAVIAAAANEMDSYLGRRYSIPVVVDAQVAEERSDALFLANVNAQLASGRLITSAASGGENTDVHAYGRMLLSTAIKALKDIQDGKYDLLSATPLPSQANRLQGPIIISKDKFSQVDAFYDSYGTQPCGLREGQPWHRSV